ncbi:Conserved oligomeric Golgi complex subunit 4 [Galdieria sulphuraria]|uniref:COG4 transport protein middle alpha-helical bundle domain-containing protein n=1 Tax=Galdieria sulphuraria TaxID=130081 RepID=M2WRY8_GALSU|nr:uncharacterized protein Gasu_57250 [Galdieria sulphuraria]EME26600.1 hypothetical protein Gasu_57250 [Galdieria sulphuraria]GJD08698.1 Conserved oligomeric Golgi complex subunit 4 [Galdieria sulphuraria]|eukprot:XP_005703120.1 hypothetical protein Gasu_57250 [Galdieria sulphuraria]
MSQETLSQEDMDKILEREISQVTAKLVDMDQKIHILAEQLAAKEERQRTIFDLLTTQVWDVETESTDFELSWKTFHIEDICNNLSSFHLQSCRLEETQQLLKTAMKTREVLSQLRSCFSRGHLKEAVDHASELRRLSCENSAQMEFLEKILEEQPVVDEELHSLKNSLRQYIKDSTSKGYDAVSQVYEHCVDLFRVGEEEEAFELYLSFLLNIIQKELSDPLSKLRQKGDTSSRFSSQCISCLTQLYECIASYADENEGRLTKDWSEQYYPLLLKRLQSVCNEYGAEILDIYRHFRHLENTQSYLTTETRQLDVVMDEMALISQRTNAYFHFIQNKLDKHNNPGALETSKFFRECLLQRKLDELISAYISMENYFMAESIKKAISLDEISKDSGTILVSTVVDDCFFVIQKSIKRAFAFENNDVLCAIINETNAVMSRQALGFFKNRLVQTLMSQKETNRIESYASKPLDKSRNVTQQLVVLLNNLHNCEEYGERLIGWLDTASRKRNSAASELEKIQSVVGDLKDALKAFHSMWEEILEHLKTRITSKLVRTLEPLQQMSFILQEDNLLGDLEASSSFIYNFMEQFDNSVGYLENLLIDSNWDQLIRQMADWTAAHLESILWRKKFNSHGALRLDNDIRSITSFFNNKVKQGTVRDIFTRLFQLTMLLNLESPTEIDDIWQREEDKHIRWKLTAEEVREVLSLRTEFSSETIRHLSL